MNSPLPIRITKAVVMMVAVIWSAVPVLFIVISSFKSNADIFGYPPTLIFTPTLGHYHDLLTQWPDFLRTLMNSFIVTVFATVVCILASVLAGYVYSRYRNSFLAGSAYFMIGVRLLPPIVVTLPLFPVVNMLHLNDTYTVLVVLYSAFFVSLSTLILKSFMDGVPRELDQAAIIDGASEFQYLFRIIFPLAAQGMAATAVFVLVFSWNEYVFAFIFTTARAKTAPLILSEMMGAITGVDWGVLFAAVTVQMVPVVLFVILAQKFLISGLTAGAIKG